MTPGSLLQKIIYRLLKFYNRKPGGLVIAKPAGSGLKSNASFYDLKINDIDGGELNFQSFRGKKVLLVNTASECGYTGQYADLEKLYNQYKNTVVVAGFPSNNFGKQEPGTNREIKQFCIDSYHVSFPLSEKITVTGHNVHPVYRWLTDSSLNGWNDKQPRWNFCKYLVDEQGELVCFYSEKTNPFDKAILKRL